MKSIIKEIIIAHEKALQPDEIEHFFKEIETSILMLRFKHRKFKIEYDENMFSKQEAMPQAAYVIALWGFLNYSERTFGTVLDVINSFVEYDFYFLSEIDFERTASGAMRALTNLRFAGDKLKKWGVVSEEKKDDWSAYQLTELGKKKWDELEVFLSGTKRHLKGKPFDDNYFNSQTFNNFAKSEVISRLIQKMK